MKPEEIFQRQMKSIDENPWRFDSSIEGDIKGLQARVDIIIEYLTTQLKKDETL